jgi:hypothetical protein
MRFTADRKVNIISDFFVLPVDASSQSTQIAGDANVCAGTKSKGQCYYLEAGEMEGLICVLDSDPVRRALHVCRSVASKKSFIISLVEEIYVLANKKRGLVDALTKKQVDAAVTPINQVVPAAVLDVTQHDLLGCLRLGFVLALCCCDVCLSGLVLPLS